MSWKKFSGIEDFIVVLLFETIFFFGSFDERKVQSPFSKVLTF